MSHTEAEAMKKWCPMYRVATSGGEATSTYEIDNRPLEYAPTEDKEAPWHATGGILSLGCCIGSRCMAWQWTSPIAHPDIPRSPYDRGYCGLAHHTGYS